ncbi:MAG: DUF1573 domain-containing protein [Saprospiraceae bacterium]
MKMILKKVSPVILFFILCGMHNLQAQSVTWLTPTEHDFGVLKQYHPDTVYFTFKNISGYDMVIDNVRTTCGCTAPNWSMEPIPADSTSTILIEYNSKNLGYFEKKIKVYYAGIRKAEVLRIEGEVVE